MTSFFPLLFNCKLRWFSRTITESSEANTMKYHTTLDMQMKISLEENLLLQRKQTGQPSAQGSMSAQSHNCITR